MKKQVAIFMLAFFCVFFVGCSSSHGVNYSSDSNEESNSVTFTDSLNREVTVCSHERVVTLLGSFCDEWILAGGTVVGTASDSFVSFDLNLPDSVVDIGSHMKPDIEKILSLSPDFIIASSGTAICKVALRDIIPAFSVGNN